MTGFNLLRLSHVSLGAKDLESLVAFYVNNLNLKIAHEFLNDEGFRYGVFLFAGGGTFIELFQDQKPVRTGGQFRHFCIEVDDIQGIATVMRELGFSPEVRRGRTDRVLQFCIEDPEGNVVEFHEHDNQSALYKFVNYDS